MCKPPGCPYYTPRQSPLRAILIRGFVARTNNMDAFRTAYSHHGWAFWLALAAGVVLLALWSAFVHRRTRRLEARLDDLFGNLSSENTAQRLAEYLSTVRATAANVAEMREQHERLLRIMPSVVRHVGLVRFSPF